MSLTTVSLASNQRFVEGLQFHITIWVL